MKYPGRKFYIILLFLFAAGYLWLGVNYFYSGTIDPQLNSTCLIKNFVGIPCPSCGTTRSLNLLLQGNFLSAFYLNPLGILSGVILLIVPVWLMTDLFRGKYTFLFSFKKIEIMFRKKKIAIFSVSLILANWMWSISKGL